MGRAGGPTLGFDADLLLEGGFPVLAAVALAAAVVYQIHQESHSSNGGS